MRGTLFGEYERTGTRRDLAAVRLLAPVIPPTLYAAGMNYATHVKEALELLGNTVTVAKKPRYRLPGGQRDHRAGRTDRDPQGLIGVVQFEGELAVVIAQAREAWSEEDALSCVLGYTIGNDVSERTWQASDRTLWRAKNTDTFKPMGPVIETDVDLESLITRIKRERDAAIRVPHQQCDRRRCALSQHDVALSDAASGRRRLMARKRRAATWCSAILSRSRSPALARCATR